jgi:hypothetical protein
MEKSPGRHGLVAVMLVGLLLLCADLAHAQVTLTLATTTAVINVDDTAGRWQFDGGTVSLEGDVIGNFARTKRVVFGATSPQNTAMLTITIFFLGADPPETVTLQGSHSFNNGEERGSISAASAGLDGAVGVTFQGPSSALTFNLP